MFGPHTGTAPQRARTPAVFDALWVAAISTALAFMLLLVLAPPRVSPTSSGPL